jgi:GNAT superfamily N-acetyltransferase
VRLVDVRDPEELARVYEDILVPSFPATELMPASWLTDGVSRDDVAVLAAYDDGGAPVAAAVTERICPGVVLLTYLAALPSSRGSGVGSRLLTRVRDTAVAARASLLLAEVERPDRHAGSDEHGDPTARLRFYERYGARILDLPYVQPPIGPEAAPVPGMLMLALHVAPEALRDGGTSVDGALVAQAFEHLLGDEADDDADLAALRAAARRPVTGIVPITQWRSVAASPHPTAPPHPRASM